jgi:hypothetical protein
MLSGAKHLQYLLENKQLQILRSAQDDSAPGFFCNLLESRESKVEARKWGVESWRLGEEISRSFADSDFLEFGIWNLRFEVEVKTLPCHARGFELAAIGWIGSERDNNGFYGVREAPKSE